MYLDDQCHTKISPTAAAAGWKGNNWNLQSGVSSNELQKKLEVCRVYT